MKIRTIKSNMTELEVNGATILFSYETPVAANVKGKFYRTQTKWSVTTSKHINQWLDGAKAESKPQSFFDDLVK